MSYNMTALQQVDTVGKLFQFADNSTGNLLFGFIIVAIFFIMLLVMKRWEFDKALLSSSFASFIMSLILSYAGYLSFFPWVLIFLIVMALTGFYMYMTR